MSILTNRIYYINSENRLSGTSSNFTYQIEIPDTLKVDTCCVTAMTIPKSFYLIRSGYNAVNVTLDGVPHLIEIEPGNYTAEDFIDTFLLAANALSLGVFTMTLSTITGKYTYGYTGSATTVSFDLEDPSLLGHQMGFPEVSSTPFIQTSESPVGTFHFKLVSTNVLDFVGTSTLFLHSNMVDDTTSILQEVYSDNTVPFSNIVYNCKFPGMYSKKMTKTTSSEFTFTLTDEHDNPVFLNGHDINITLLIYKKENLTGLFQRIFPPASAS